MGALAASRARASTDAAAAPAPAEASEEPRVRAYRPLGRTGFRMSDISMGGAEAGPTADTYLEALRLGINYLDTAPDYFSGENERVIGEALSRWNGRREDVWITTKMCTTRAVTGHLPWDASKQDFLDALAGSLERLGLAHVDCWLLHGLGGSPFHQKERFESEALWAAVAEARERGLARTIGVSSHGPFHKLDHLNRVVESGKVDLILTAYSHLGGKGGTSVAEMRALFEKAHAKGMGVVAMKTVPRASYAEKEALAAEMDGDVGSYPQLCFRWVLETPQVSGLIKSMRSVHELRDFLGASGRALTPPAAAELQRYGAAIDAETCRIGCGDCLGACPAGVEVPTLLRFGSYFEDYGRQREAMLRYRAAGGHEQAAACLGCAAPCRGACPYDLDIPALVAHADGLLHFPEEADTFKG